MTLKLREVVVHRGSFRLAADLEVAADGVTVVFGPSGSGKSSLLATIAGLSRLEAGSISLHDRVLEDTRKAVRVPAHARGIGLVLVGHQTGAAIGDQGLRAHRLGRGERRGHDE